MSASKDVSMTCQGHIGERSPRFLLSKFSNLWFVYILSSSFHTDRHSVLSTLPFTAETPMDFPPDKGLPTFHLLFLVTCSRHTSKSVIINITPNLPQDDQDQLFRFSIHRFWRFLFDAEQLSGRHSLMKPNTPELLNSTELFGTIPMEIITNFPVGSLEPRIITTNPDTSEPFNLNGFWRRWLIICSLNLPITTLTLCQRWKLYRQLKANGLTGTARHRQCRQKFSPHQLHQGWLVEWMC